MKIAECCQETRRKVLLRMTCDPLTGDIVRTCVCVSLCPLTVTSRWVGIMRCSDSSVCDPQNVFHLALPAPWCYSSTTHSACLVHFLPHTFLEDWLGQWVLPSDSFCRRGSWVPIRAVTQFPTGNRRQTNSFAVWENEIVFSNNRASST